MQNVVKDQIHKQNKEVNIIDLFIFLLKYKKIIISFVIITGIATPSYFYLTERFKKGHDTAQIVSPKKVYYYSECVISPSNDFYFYTPHNAHNGTELLKIMLLGRDINLMVAKKNHLPIIRNDFWDEKSNKLVTACVYIWDNKNDTLEKRESYSKITEDNTATLYVKIQDGITTVGFFSDEPRKSLSILNNYIDCLSDYFRMRNKEIINAQQDLYKKQIAIAHDPYMKSRLLEKIIEANNMELMARSSRYYGINMISPPFTVEINPRAKESSAKRHIVMITFLLILAAFVIAVSIAGCIEYFSFAKKDNPEKYAILMKYLPFKNWRRNDQD